VSLRFGGIPALLFSVLLAQQQPALRLQQAIDLTETRGNCVAAIPIFEDLARSSVRDVAARSLLYAGRCYEQLGRPEAADTYRELETQFPEQRQSVAAARTRLAALDRSRPAGNLSEILLPGPRVIALIPVGEPPSNSVIASGGREVYVSSSRGRRVTVIDTASNTHKLVLRFPWQPHALAVSPDGSKVYVGSYPEHGLHIIDTRTKEVTTVDTAGPTMDLAVSSDGRYLYLALEAAGVARFDTVAASSTSLSHEKYAVGLALSPGGRSLWVSYQGGEPRGRRGHDAIVKLDTLTGAALATFQGPPYVGSPLTMTGDGTRIWTSSEDACISPQYDHQGCPPGAKTMIHVIDSASGRLAHSLTFASRVEGITILDCAPLAAVSSFGKLQFFDARTFALAASPPIPAVGRLAITPDGWHAYAPLPDRSALAFIELFLPAQASLAVKGAISLRSESLLRVVVVGDEGMNFGQVDLSSIHFAGAAVSKDSRGKPLATVQYGKEMPLYLDLVFYVRANALRLKPGEREA
jgi:DNA-binding beta-propeller fold protein YncE